MVTVEPRSITGPGNGSVAVNRATPRDIHVVVSWTTDDGNREAASLTPEDARFMATALIVAAAVVEGKIGER